MRLLLELTMPRFVLTCICILLLNHATLLLAAKCKDKLKECPSYMPMCNNAEIRKTCQLTCNNCPSDACSINNGGCDQFCNSTEDKVVCSCFPGFKLQQDKTTCKDIDECREGPNPCKYFPGFCVNNVGSYSCESYNCSKPGSMNYYRSGKCCHVVNSTCGMSASIRQRLPHSDNRFQGLVQKVYGGRISAMYAWPWQTQILYRGRQHCGGSLIANKWVVGAAHCFEKFSFYLMKVYFGTTRGAHLISQSRSNIEQRRIIRIIVPSTSIRHIDDIALIELNQPIVYNDFIRPICLPCGESPKLDDRCWVTGFGRTETSGREASSKLMEADVPVVSSHACAKAFENVSYINPDKMMCAGYKTGGKDACIGDSGGPLACQRADSCEWYLSGITSFGKGCGLPNYYGVYTNVVNYEDWILEKLGENVTGLCNKIYNRCRQMNNIDSDCYTKLDRCSSFPHYMSTNCQLACCQLKNKEISNCFDAESRSGVCEMYKHQCNHSLFGELVRKKCRKTCNLC